MIELYELRREIENWQPLSLDVKELSQFVEKLLTLVIAIEERLDSLEEYHRCDE